MINKITFEIETITPMFLAGADQSKAELRAASIKGLLRFWWRALQAETDLERLREKESEIFGCSDEKIGGSSFSIRVLYEKPPIPVKGTLPKQNITVTSKGKTFPVNILEYLAYGTLEYRKGEGNVFIREYFPAGTKFLLSLSSKMNSIKELLRTFLVFWLFGGIGARSRNGFGSFHVTNHVETLSSVGEGDYKYEHLIHKIIKETPPQSYPSFAAGTKLFRTKTTYKTWDMALAEVGKIYRGIRVGEKRLNDLVFEQKHTFSKREYIGAPLDPYQENFQSFLDRHAKPYFIKIAREGDKYRAYVLYLPSKYCSGREKDRNEHTINHKYVDHQFADVCAEFNNFLSESMDSIIYKGG